MSATQPIAPPRHPDEWKVDLVLRGMVVLFAASIALVVAPVVASALVALLLVKMNAVKWWWIALGAAAVYLALTLFDKNGLEMIERAFRKANEISTRKGFGTAVERIWSHWPKWSGRTIPAIPVGAIIGAVIGSLFDRRYPVFDPREEVQKRNAITVARDHAARKVRKAPVTAKGLAVLGPFAHGDLPKPWVQRFRLFSYLCFHPTLLGRHAVVVGKPGSGKTTTLLRLAYLAAHVYGWRVYFLDGKGDVQTMRDFTALMLAAGVPASEIGAFPVEPFDGWRTTGDFRHGYSQLLNRLMGALEFSEPYYRDMTRRYLSRALRMGDALPRSSSELLERLTQLANEASADEKREALSTRNRFESLFDSFPGQFDGGWSFSDYRAGYVLLKGLSNRDEAKNAAGYLFECFKQFATDMKDPEDRVLLIVDEFPAVMGDSDAAGMIERLRSFGCGVALSAQNYEGLGHDRARIIEAAATVILHRLSLSDELARLAGTVEEYAVTTQIDFDARATGRGTATPEHRFKAEPNLIGRQRDGEITVVNDRCVGHGFVTKLDPGPWQADASRILTRPVGAKPSRAPREVPSAADVVELR